MDGKCGTDANVVMNMRWTTNNKYAVDTIEDNKHSSQSETSRNRYGEDGLGA